MAHPLAKNMVLCMLLNEQGSRAMDLSPSGAHGRLYGFGSPAKRHISGLDFIAATPSYVEIPAAFTQLDFTSENFSIIARVYLDTAAGYRTIFQRGARNVDGYRWLWHQDIGLAFLTSTFGVEPATYTNAGTLSAATWYTLGVSRNGALVTLYKNGVDFTAVQGDHTTIATSSRTAKIGSSDTVTEFPFDGKIEFLRVWKHKVLTELEHKAIYENPYAPYGSKMFI